MRTGAVAIRPEYDRLAGLSWLHFLNDGAANYLPGILPALLFALGLNAELAGAAMTALMVGQALQPVTGWLADYYGGRAFVIVGMIGTCLGGALIGLIPSPWLLMPVLLMMGCANSLFHPQAMAITRTLAGGRTALSMALFLVGGEIGRGVWPLFAGLVVADGGLHQLWILGMPALVTAPLLWRNLPLQPALRKKMTRINWRAQAAPTGVLICFTSLRALAIFGVTTFLPLLSHSRGHSLVTGAGMISVLLVVGIIGNIGGGYIADRIGWRAVLLGSSLGGAGLLGAFLLANGLWQWVLLGLLGIMLFASLPLSILIAQELFPKNRSFSSGVALGFCNGLAALGLIALGAISDAWGQETVLWLLTGTLILAALLSLWVASPRDVS